MSPMTSPSTPAGLVGLSDDLREGLAEMAVRCTVPMQLWDTFSNDVLSAAKAITALTTRNAVLEQELEEARGALAVARRQTDAFRRTNENLHTAYCEAVGDVDHE